MILLSQTYEIVTEESAEHGEAAERGIDWEGVPHGFRETVGLIKGGFDLPSDSPGVPRWLSTQGYQDYRTGETETKSLHPASDPRSQRYWAKACHGLAKGEKRQVVNGRTGQPVWELRVDLQGAPLATPLEPGEDSSDLPLYRLQAVKGSDSPPEELPRIFWAPSWVVGVGKERELAAARRVAAWPEATDEQLSLPKEELEALLKARLPKLLKDFRKDVEAAGLLWEPK